MLCFGDFLPKCLTDGLPQLVSVEHVALHEVWLQDKNVGPGVFCILILLETFLAAQPSWVSAST